MTQNKPTEEQIEAELIQRILTGDWTPGQIATFEALHDPELTGEEILIAGLEAEIARRDAVIEAQAEEIERLRVILRWIYARADESDGGRIYFLGKELDQIKAAIEAANEQS